MSLTVLSLFFFWDLAPLSTYIYSFNYQDHSLKLLALFPCYQAAGLLCLGSVFDFVPLFWRQHGRLCRVGNGPEWLLYICILFSQWILFHFPFLCALLTRCRWFPVRPEAFTELKPQKRVCFLLCCAWRTQKPSVSQGKRSNGTFHLTLPRTGPSRRETVSLFLLICLDPDVHFLILSF